MKKTYIALFGTVLIIIFCFYTVQGTFIKKIPLLSLDKVTVIEEFTSEKPGERIKIDQLIDDYLAKNIDYRLVNGRIFAAHYVYGFGTNEEKKSLIAYIWSIQKEFTKANGFSRYGASFSRPMVVYLERNNLGNLKVKNYKTPIEGEEYVNSITELFPKEYQDRIMSKENEAVVFDFIRHSIANYIVDSSK